MKANPFRIIWLLAAVAAILVATAPAQAITSGEPDGSDHPYVGLVFFYDAAGEPQWRCTGTLLSGTVFLTAGHCTEGAASAQVWFDPTVIRGSGGFGYPYTGGVKSSEIHTHPFFQLVFPNTSDVGLVILGEPVDPSGTGTYGQLPTTGYLDQLANKRGIQRDQLVFTNVGYGLQEVVPNFQSDLTRYKSTAMLVNLTSALTDGFNIHASNNPGIGGGTCFGDSGGPVFHMNTNVVVGITSFGLNENCKGADFAYRTDIQNSLDFIQAFLQ